MDIAVTFASIAQGVSSSFGGPYHPATLYRAAAYEKADDGTITGGEPAALACVAQIDRVSEALRKELGFTEAEVAVYVLAASLSGPVTSDDEIMAAAGPFAGQRWKLTAAVRRDPMGVYWAAPGVRA